MLLIIFRKILIGIQGCASLLISTLFSLGGLPTHPQNPNSWRTSLSLLVWPLRNVTGYTRLDKIRSEVIRKELEISRIQDVKLKYKQNWISHLERMENTRLPKHGLNYKPRGRRDRGRSRKRWQYVDAGTVQTT